MKFMKFCLRCCFAMLLWTGLALMGQDTNGVPGAPVPTAGLFASPQFIVDFLTPILTLLIAQGIEKLKPQISMAWLAAAVLSLGTVGSALATVVLGSGTSVVSVLKAAGLSLAGVVVKVILDKLKTEPPTTNTVK